MRVDGRAASTPPLRAIAQMAGTFAASDLLRGGIRFATSLVIARGLGPSGFGRWTLCAAAASALTVVFDLGFGVLLTREAAREPRRSMPLAAGAMAVRLLAFFPAGLWLCVAPGSLGITGPREIAIATAALAAAGIAHGSIGAVFRADPPRLVRILLLEAAGGVAQCGGAFVIVSRGGSVADLLGLAAAVLIAQAIGAALLLRSIAPADADAALTPRVALSLLRRALPFAASGVIANAQARLGPLMLGALSDPGEIAAFGVATRLEGIARRLPYAAFGAALPVFSSASGRATEVRARFDAAVRVFAGAAAIALIAGASMLVSVTYGRAFDTAVVPLMWAGAALVPSLVNGSRKVYLNATGRERIVVRWAATALAIDIAAAIVLVPRFGASGAMGAMALGELAIWAPLRTAERTVRSEAEQPHESAASLGAALPV